MHPKVEGKMSWISNSTLSDLADLTFIAIKITIYSTIFGLCNGNLDSIIYASTIFGLYRAGYKLQLTESIYSTYVAYMSSHHSIIKMLWATADGPLY